MDSGENRKRNWGRMIHLLQGQLLISNFSDVLKLLFAIKSK